MDSESKSDFTTNRVGEVSPFDFKIFTSNDTDVNNYKVNDVYDFELFKFPNNYAFLYVFKTGVRCVKFQYKDKTVWKYDKEEHSENQFPKSIYFKNVAKEALVYFNDFVSHTYSLVGEEWVYKEERSKNLTVSLKPGDKVVELDIDRKESTENFQYYINGDAFTYSAWAGIKFQVIKNGGVELWRAMPNRYAHRLDLCKTKSGKFAMVVYLDGNQRVLSLRGESYEVNEYDNENPNRETERETNKELNSRLDRFKYKILAADDPYTLNYRTNDGRDFVASTCTEKSLFVQFKRRLGFVELKYKDKSIWNNVSFMGDSYLASLHFIPKDKKVVVWINKKAPVVYNVTLED